MLSRTIGRAVILLFVEALLFTLFAAFMKTYETGRVIAFLLYFIPKLSDSPRSRVLSTYLTREAEMPQTLLECDTLKSWAIDP